MICHVRRSAAWSPGPRRTVTSETGTSEATPGSFGRTIVDVEFCQFVGGHATFVTEDGRCFGFKVGDVAYFPPGARGMWTIHETVRKIYCIWR